MKPFVVAITGASGAAYGIRLVQVLAESGYPVEVVISEAGRLVIREETGLALKSFTDADALREFFGPAAGLRAYSPKDFTAPIASGSYPTSGMAIVPCSMGTLGALSSGVSQNLVHRAADYAMKEGRRLVLMPRETPLSAIHLENMLKLARLGVRIVPAMPAFYCGAEDVKDLVDFMVGRVLDQFEIPHALYRRWTGALSARKDLPV